MACMYSQYMDSAERAITPMISGIRIADNGYYGYQTPVVNGYHGHHQHEFGGGGGGGGLGAGGLKMDSEAVIGGFCGGAVLPLEGSVDSSQVGAGGGGGGGGGGCRSRKCKEEKVCGVCGDKALGFNFDAISCESCKAFFRRNAPKGLGYFKCPYDEKCKMDLSNRRFCKRCRLKKCFEIGMRKEYILTDEEKAQKRQKIEENKYLKKMCIMSTGEPELGSRDQLDNPSPVPPVVIPLPPPPLPPPALPPPPPPPPTQPPPPPPPHPPVTSQTTVLTPRDAEAICALHVAYRNSLEVSMDRDVSRHGASFLDLVNIAELSVRRVIAMAKQVPAFRSLPQVEQIHLLKGGSIELLILRSVITFDKEKQQFLDPVDQEETKAMKLEQLEKAENGTGLFEDHMKFVRKLVFDLQADETMLILLLVLSLFSPDRENLEHKTLVAGEQERYSVLLKNYLESIYPVPVARTTFPRLLMSLTDIRNLNEEHSQVLLKVNPDGIQPLMKEVLDLSC